jgi:hypothetical protein
MAAESVWEVSIALISGDLCAWHPSSAHARCTGNVSPCRPCLNELQSMKKDEARGVVLQARVDHEIATERARY